nr:hypothetical protein [Tanacetum cinerariifolium]
TYPTTTLLEIPSFVSLFQFDQKTSALETKVSEFNQISQFAEALSLISSIVDNYLASKIKEEVNVAVLLQLNKLKEKAEAENQEFINQIKEEVNVAVLLQLNKLKEKAKTENQEFINQVDSTIKKIIKEHVKDQVSKIMPLIKKYVSESLGAEVLVRSSNQPQTSYAVAASLSEFELKKILINKMETNKSINRSDIQKNLYNALVEAYNLDKDIFTSYGDDDEPSKGSKSKESKSSSSSKGTQSQHKSSGKSTQAEELEFETVDTEMHQDQWNESGHIDDQPDNEAVPKHDWF